MENRGTKSHERMGVYGPYGSLNDRIDHHRDYADEAHRLRDELVQHGISDGDRMLVAGCGTGQLLEQLMIHYDVAGFDRDESALFIARQRVPDAALWHTDMSNFTVEAPYNVVACLSSSISYLKSLEALTSACQSFFEATRPGGVTIIEPWLTPEQCTRGEALMQTYDGPDMKLVRSAVTQIRSHTAHLDYHWMVAQPMLGVRTFIEQQRRILLSRQDIQTAMESAGFTVAHQPSAFSQRGLWIGRRQN